MKTLATLALSSVLFSVGCKTATLVGREWPPSDGSSSGGATDVGSNMMVPVAKDSDASLPPPPVDAIGPDVGAATDAPAIILGPPPGVDPPFTIPDAFAGEWTGYLEAFQLASGSDAITLRLTRTAGQVDRIELVLGTGPASGPTGLDPWTAVPPLGALGPRPQYAEGYSYLAHQVSWKNDRLVFRISQNDAWQNWCAARTSFPVDGQSGAFSCANNVDDPAFSNCIRLSKLAEQVPPGCVAYWACRQTMVCTCNSSRCASTFALDGTVDVTFESPVTGALNIGAYAAFRLVRTATADAGAPDATDAAGQ